jgi:predicted RNA-binding Zn-ribbon protein involved in translation (DUF1610 family)
MSKLKDKPLKKCHTDDRQMIDDIHNKIVKELNDTDLTKYYLDNGLILNDYYSNKNETKVTTNNGILSYFDKKEDNNKEENNVINDYMKNIDDRIVNERYKDYNYYKCESCKNNMQINEIISELICDNCGNTINIMITTEKNSYNDPPKEVNYFSYKRINHFNEWLAQFQAKETTEIPDSIYQKINTEIKQNINLNITNINYKQVREILKKLNYNKYYEHIPYLINIISGKESPKLTRKEEEILRSLFKEIQIPFMKHCPPDRKNFLSYSYVLHKFCELLEYDNLLCYFTLLKSREKLQQQDKIWKNICQELKWEYIPSA